MESLESMNNLHDSAILLDARSGDLCGLRDKIDLLDHQLKAQEPCCSVAEVLADHRNKLGKTVLHEAAQNNHNEAVQYLLSVLKIDPDCLKQGDWTPLMLAVIKSDIATVKSLVEAGASLSLRNKDGWNVFHLAAREGRLNVLKILLEKDPNAWSTTSNNRRTPLHTAALHGRIEVVEFLIGRCGYNRDEKDSCGITPLMDAIKSGSLNIARLLISQQKVNPLCRDNLGRSAIHIAAEIGQPESMRFLVRELNLSPNTLAEDSGLSPAHFAAKLRTRIPYPFNITHSFTSMLSTMNERIFAYAKPVFQNQEGHLSILEILREHDGELHRRDRKFGRTPLDLAVIAKQKSVIQYLLMEKKTIS